MANVITRRALSRRTILRGVGAMVAIPWLDAMEPALSTMLGIGRRRESVAPDRHLFCFMPNGVKMDEWRPTKTGKLGELPRILAPLEKSKKDLLVISGLDLEGGKAQGDGPGDHARAAASFLTTAHPRKTGGEGIFNGVSIDQVMADHVGDATALRSLEVGMEGGRRAGSCDSGYSCAYTTNISWKTPTTPVAKEVDPREVWRRLFGDPDAAGNAAAAARRRTRQGRVLDAVLEDAKSLRVKLSRNDRAKLDDYLDSLRAMERRLDREAQPEGDATPVLSAEILERDAEGYAGRLELMYELLALAFETDMTRVATFMIGNAGSPRSYRNLGITESHHDLSHHGGDASKHDQIAQINVFHLTAFARFVSLLAEKEERGERLLDRTAVMLGSGLADGNSHQHVDLPVLVAGGGNRLRLGRHVRADRGTSLGALYLALLNKTGVASREFGDAAAALGEI